MRTQRQSAAREGHGNLLVRAVGFIYKFGRDHECCQQQPLNRVAGQDCPLAVPVDVLYALEVDEADDETAVCVRVREGAGDFDLQRKRKKGEAPEFRKSRTKRNGSSMVCTSIFSYFFYHMYAFVPRAALRVLQDPLHIC
jgi:hypothetical protein